MVSSHSINSLVKSERKHGREEALKEMLPDLKEMEMVHFCKGHGVIPSSQVSMDQDGTFYCTKADPGAESCWEITRWANPLAKAIVEKIKKELGEK